ncbi:hypothetical protein BDQ17DRAFT_1236780, partial [Cyathus striatus]
YGVRIEWNTAAIQKHCVQNRQQVFVCRADDTIDGEKLSIKAEYAVVMHDYEKGKGRRNSLPVSVQLAIGMKVMVIQNVETNLDITNGARGEAVNIILDTDEVIVNSGMVTELQHPLVYILVKLSQTWASKLQGLEESVIHVQPLV